MNFMSWIIEALTAISKWFYSVYLEVLGWVWPFYKAAEFFYFLCILFNNLAIYFYYFNDWVNSVIVSVARILSWDTIWQFILSYVPKILDIQSWWIDRVNQILGVINNWWWSWQQVILYWIQAAKDELNLLISKVELAATSLVNALAATVEASISNFNSLITSLQTSVNTLTASLTNLSYAINYIFREFFNRVGDIDATIQGWTYVRDQVFSFFTDPLEFLWSRFTDWFLGREA